MCSGFRGGRACKAVAIFRKHSPLLTLDVWTRAPAEAMVQSLQYIDETYGSVAGYLSHIGFDSEWQARLKAALKKKTLTTVQL